MEFRIKKAIEAEKDEYLIECFYDSGFIEELLSEGSTIISWRKWTWKTWIAKYLENQYLNYQLEYVCHISLKGISINKTFNKNEQINLFLGYILIESVKNLLQRGLLDNDNITFWKDYLQNNGFQNISDYSEFVEQQKKITEALDGKANGWFFWIWAKKSTETIYNKNIAINNPTSIIRNLKESIKGDCKKIVIFIDDITDHLDDSTDDTFDSDLSLVKDLLLKIDDYNSELFWSLVFISLLRDDLFDLMDSSNTNKLKNSSLKLEWKEKDFAWFLIKRLPLFHDSIEASLADPIKAIKKQFPDDIFKDLTNADSVQLHQFSSQFYAYMVAISFNRPRDFLKFCYAMRDRLSQKEHATKENIESAEIEYSDYFQTEIRDELLLAMKKMKVNFNIEKMNSLIDLLASKDWFNNSELKVNLSKYLDEKTSNKKVEVFISELYRYWILWLTEGKDTLLRFSYIGGRIIFTLAKIKDYSYHLHRGLYWFTKKRKR